jgi:hypothetical protein
MIAKQIKGSSFYGVLKYMEKKVENGVGKYLHANMYGHNPVELNKEFELVQSLRPNVKKAVYHVSINLSPEENLTDDQFKDIADKYLTEMGFDSNQFVAYRHFDRDHSHIHIIANRIKYDGSLVSDSNDYKRSEKIIRQLEREYGLKQVKDSKYSQTKAPSKGMIENSMKTGEAPIILQLQEILDKAILGKPTTEKFVQRLTKSGVDVRFYTNRNGVYGMSFTLDGFAVKASSLGRKFQWKNFKNVINYNYERDIKTINEKSHRGKGTSTQRTGGKSAFAEYGKHRGYERGTSTDSLLSEANDFICGRRKHADIPSAESIAKDITASWSSDRGAKINTAENNKDKKSHFHKDSSAIDTHRERSWKPNLPNIAMDAIAPKKATDGEEEERIKRKKRQRNL